MTEFVLGPAGAENAEYKETLPFIRRKKSTAMIVSLLILAVLKKSHQAVYGQEIERELERVMQGTWRPAEGTIYTHLARLEEWGWIKGEWEDQTKRKRRYYTLTPFGRERMEETLREVKEELEAAKAAAGLAYAFLYEKAPF